ECPGDNATFATTPSGTGPFTFVWRKDGSVIANQTNASLTLLSVVATNAGTYSVIVSGNCNSVTNSATLTVNTNTASTALVSLIECPGDNATFATTPSGTGPFTFVWRKDGSVIANQTNASLTLLSVVATNAGTYSVIVSGNCNSVTNSATLTINTNTASTALVSLIECPGDNATFATTPSGTGPFTFVWRKDGSVIANQTNSSLTLLSVVATNAGTYSVIVSGNCNSVTNSATLTVNTVTSLTPLQSTTNFIGNTVNFTVTASGTGPFIYVWKKDGVAISGATNNILTLPVSSASTGIYSVEATGACGTAITSASLVAVPRIQISAIQLSGNDVLINFSTKKTKFYRVECVDNFSSNAWRTVADNIPGTGAIVQAIDFGGAGKPSRFYRIREFDSIAFPRITSLAFISNDVIINFDTIAGSYYRVERTDELGSNLWVPVIDVVVGTGGILSVTDIGGAGQPQRFYRVQLLSNNYVQSLMVSTNRLTVGEGSTTNFAVSLAIQPTTNVVVKIARINGDADLDVSAGGVLTFTPANWNVPQTVSILAAVDADTLNGQATFAISSGGIAKQYLIANEADNTSQTALRIMGIQLVGTNVVVSFTSMAGNSYALEYSAGLSNSWQTATNIAGNGGVTQATDRGGATQNQRFYRLKQLP
ncbi:MAG: hypothetical protein ABIR24_06875, partial [Verrucomicrobiota bacterium]